MEFLRPPEGSRHAKRTTGRGHGSGRGRKSGKGDKGQNSRSGGGVRPGFEGGQMPIYRRVARRGFSNYPFKREATPVNLSTLQRVFKSGETVSLETLRDRGVVSRRTSFVKVLGNGEIKKKLTVKGLPLSSGARAKIEAAGGTVADEAESTGAQSTGTSVNDEKE